MVCVPISYITCCILFTDTCGGQLAVLKPTVKETSFPSRNPSYSEKQK